MIFVLIIVSQQTLTSAVSAFFVYVVLFFLNPLIIYNAIILTHYFGGSLGKLLTGLQVVNETGAPLTLKRIAFRQTIGYSFSWLVFGLGFLSIAKDAQKQGWHDKAVGSLVIVKHNLWPLALAVCTASLLGSVYLGILSWQNITTGPLKLEMQMIQKNISQEISNDNQKSIAPSVRPSQRLENGKEVWKIYTNKGPEFEMKYPADWEKPASTSGMVNFYNGYRGIDHKGVWATVFATYVGDGQYPGAVPEFESRYKSPPGTINTVPSKTATKLRNVKIDGINAVEYEEVDNQTDVIGYSINYQMVKDNYIYQIAFSTVDKDLFDDSRGVFDEMIQSFWFSK
jgi:hypothetical protein